MRIFGPASITYSGLSIGRTYKGCTFSLNTRESKLVGADTETIRRAVSGAGVIKAFELLTTISVISDLMASDYQQMIFTGVNYTLTFPSARLFWPNKLNFGTNELTTIDLDFVFRLNGQLYTLI